MLSAIAIGCVYFLAKVHYFVSEYTKSHLKGIQIDGALIEVLIVKQSRMWCTKAGFAFYSNQFS